MKFGSHFTRDDARLLLEKKLYGILVSTNNGTLLPLNISFSCLALLSLHSQAPNSRTCRLSTLPSNLHTTALLFLNLQLLSWLTSCSVLEEHGWTRQVLHIWATHQHVANIVEEEFWRVPKELRGNTIVVITVCTRSSAPACVFTSNELVQHLIFDATGQEAGELEMAASREGEMAYPQ